MSQLLPEEFFKTFVNYYPYEWKELPQSGSSRKNFVGICRGRKYVVTQNDNIEENRSFIYFSKTFTNLQLSAPAVFDVSEDEKLYVQQYLGDKTLSEIISEEGLSERVKTLVKNTIRQLFELQQKTKGKIDFSKTFEYETYDQIPVSYDLFYFKFMFADILEVQYHKTRLLKEFKKIESLIESLQPTGLMIRDFQSRNIMVNLEDDVFFIDYQSAMKGPLMYDLVSFLYQAKANFPENFRQEILDFYYSLWNDKDIEIQLKNQLKPLQLMRFLQVLGVYGFRGLVQRKTHFLESIEKGIDNLVQFSENWEQMSDFPELEKVILQLDAETIKDKINTIINN